MKNRWFHLILCLLVGAIVGREVGVREVNAHQVAYSQALEENYVDSPIWMLVTSISTITAAEEKLNDRVIDNNGMMLRGAFLTLVDLHKYGHYKGRDAEMRKHLERAKAFMADRPNLFIDQKLSTLSSIVDHINHSDMSLEAEDTKVTNQARDQLKEAFAYVDSLGKLRK